MEERRISISEEILRQLLDVVGTHSYNDVGNLLNSAQQDAALIQPQKVEKDDDK